MPTPSIVFKSTEFTDKRAIGTILQNWDVIQTRLKERYEYVMESWKDGNGKEYDPRVMLQKYFTQIKKINGKDCVKVGYSYSRAISSGRKFIIGGGLQSFSRPIRHTLAKGLYRDYDIVNCHPVLLTQYCHKKGYSCDKIEAYIKNRTQYLKELVEVNEKLWNESNKEWAKKVILCAVNGSMKVIPKIIRQMKHKPIWWDNFYNQCNFIKQSICEDPDNRDLIKIVKRKLVAQGKVDNLEGSVLNTILCQLENTILTSALDWCEQNCISIEFSVLCFDGFMLPEHLEIDLIAMATYIEEHTGYNVVFEEKQMNQVIDLTGLNYTEPCDDKQTVITDDHHGASILVKHIKNDVLVSQEHIYMRDGYIWTNDSNRVELLLKLKCMELNFCRVNIAGIITPYSKNVSGSNNIVQVSMLLLKANPDATLEERMFQSTLGKVCFQNGVYDFKTSSFTEWSNVSDVYTTFVIPRNYKLRNDAMVCDVRDKVFNTIFEGQEDICRDFLGAIANALSGAIHQKYSVMGLGHRNSGKGVITDLCSFAFGDYTAVFDSGVFQMDGNEEVRRNGFLIDMKNARLLFCNEAKKDDKKECIYDGTMLKKIQGGDELIGRKLYQNNQRFRIQGKVFHLFNDMPKFEPTDCLQNVENYQFCYKFVSNELFEQTDKLAYYRLANAEIKDYIRREDVCDAFFHLLIDHYSAIRCLSSASKTVCDDVREECGDIESVFKKNFKIVSDRDNEDCAVSSKEVESWLKSKNVKISTIKVKQILTGMGALWSHNKRYKGGKVSAYWGVEASFKKVINDSANEGDDYDSDLD